MISDKMGSDRLEVKDGFLHVETIVRSGHVTLIVPGCEYSSF